MILPHLYGKLDSKDFFIYAACDEKYFDEYGAVIINSVRQNTSSHLHIHIFNPRDDQLTLIADIPNLSISYEYVALDAFCIAADKWNEYSSSDIKYEIRRQLKNVSKRLCNSIPNGKISDKLSAIIRKFENQTDIEYSRYKKIVSCVKQNHDESIHDRIRKTYYACARFIRLHQLLDHSASFLAIDVDCVVRKKIILLPLNYDFYFYRKSGVNARFLAGGLYCNQTTKSRDFLNEYSNILLKNIQNDYLYWGLDQDALEDIVPKYNWGALPISYIDWFMQQDSLIWSAKGQRKKLNSFVAEQDKYRTLRKSEHPNQSLNYTL